MWALVVKSWVRGYTPSSLLPPLGGCPYLQLLAEKGFFESAPGLLEYST